MNSDLSKINSTSETQPENIKKNSNIEIDIKIIISHNLGEALDLPEQNGNTANPVILKKDVKQALEAASNYSE